LSIVLVTDCETRKALCVVRNLGASGHRVLCFGKNKFNMTKYSKYCQSFILQKSINDNDLINELNFIIKTEKVDVVIPMEDDMVRILSDSSSKLLTKTLVPDINSFNMARDKEKTMKSALLNKVSIPNTYFLNNVNEIENTNIDFPVIIKPRIGAGSKGIKKCHNKKKLIEEYNHLVNNNQHPIVQQFIEGDYKKIQVLLLFDKNSKINRSCVYEGIREYPVNGGPVTLWKTVFLPEIETKSIEWLKNENWVGFAEVEYLFNENTKEYYLMEINPRFSANIALAHFVNINFANQFVKLSLGTESSFKKNEIIDQYCQWLFPGDVLNYVFNKKRKEEKINYFFNKPYNLKDAIFSKHDPLPGLAQFVTIFSSKENFKSLKEKMKIK